MKFNGSSGVQVRMPSNLQDLAAYTSLKFYIQNPEPRSQQDGAEEGRFVLYLGSREVSWDRRAAVGSCSPTLVHQGEHCWVLLPVLMSVSGPVSPRVQATGDYLGIVLKDRKVQWVYKLGNEEPASLTVDEEIGEQFAAININRLEMGVIHSEAAHWEPVPAVHVGSAVPKRSTPKHLKKLSGKWSHHIMEALGFCLLGFMAFCKTTFRLKDDALWQSCVGRPFTQGEQGWLLFGHLHLT